MSYGRGRPSKYAKYVHQLEDGELYSRAKAVMDLKSMGAFDHIPTDELKTFCQRMRIALNNRSSRLAQDGDGSITLHGCGPIKAFYGKTWKAAYVLENDEHYRQNPPSTKLPLNDSEPINE